MIGNACAAIGSSLFFRVNGWLMGLGSEDRVPPLESSRRFLHRLDCKNHRPSAMKSCEANQLFGG
jgi:hypothetical protein